MAENLFPDDSLALKKLWAIKRGVSVDEKLALLEETFGLPFDAAYEQEEIPPVAKSSETYDRMNARAKALRSRPNRYEPELLPRGDYAGNPGTHDELKGPWDYLPDRGRNYLLG